MSEHRGSLNRSDLPSLDNEPQGKKRRRNPYAMSQPIPSTSAEDHDYVGGVFSQRSSRLSLDLVSSQEERQLVSTIIKYLLIADKTDKVISRARIIKHALGGNGRNFTQLMIKVKPVLLKTFGYKLIEFETNKYLIVNTIQNNLPHISLTPKQCAEKTLLFLILTHIFMNDEMTTEGTLWEFLRHLGVITTETFHHEYFGNIQRLINEDFVNQKYLSKIVVKESDPPKYEYRWGIRAEYEISRRSALEFVSKVFNNRSLDTWALQYKSVLAREGAGHASC